MLHKSGVYSIIVMVLTCGSLFAADYEIVDQQDSIDVQSSQFATEHHRQIVKILTDDGADYKKYLPVNNSIQIRNLDVTIASTNGRLRKMRKEDIYEVPVGDSSEMVTDYKAIEIAPDNLKKGDAVQVEYDRVITSLLYFDPWVYATSVPVRKASIVVRYPAAVPIKFRGQDSSVDVQSAENAGVTTITMQTSGQSEILLSGEAESFGQVERKVVWIPEHCMTEKWELSTKSWSDVARWFSELTRLAYHEDPAMDAVIQQVKQTARTPEEIAQALYEYIQHNFVYTAIEIGIGGYKPRFASQTFQKKYGDCKDLTFLYITLLKKAGIEAYPALVDTRDARFFYRDFPSPTQFNHCIAYLPGIKNGIWVDSTVKTFRLGEIPAVIQGKYSLVAGGPNDLVQIPEDFYNSNVIRLELAGVWSGEELQISGKVHASGQTTGYVDAMRNALLRNTVRNYVYNKLFSPALPVLQLQTEASAERTLDLKYITPILNLAPYSVLILNVVRYPALENIASEPVPNEFFAFGAPSRMIFDLSVDISGHTLVSPHFSIDQKARYISYKMQLMQEGNRIHYVADVYFTNGFLTGEEMADCKSELEAFASKLQRTVVVR